MEDHVDGFQDQPTDDQIKRRDAEDVPLLQLLKESKNEPEMVLEALRAAGLLGKLDRARGRYY